MPNDPIAKKVEELEAMLVALTDVPRLLSCSRAHLARQRAAGKFGPEVLRSGKKLLVRIEELRQWVDASMPSRVEWQAIKAAQGRRLRVS